MPNLTGVFGISVRLPFEKINVSSTSLTSNLANTSPSCSNKVNLSCSYCQVCKDAGLA